MVKVILRSLVFLNPTQVQLIRGNPRYTLMSPKEVIGNFVSFELMIARWPLHARSTTGRIHGNEREKGGVYIK
jgi:hypothetical protein